ncbi:MAG TPA: hypothetical protein ENK18_25900 [Deltaproteobacteria bacterium]|nr:hypothetical protein [Deltaproteobacteria bacterium]
MVALVASAVALATQVQLRVEPKQLAQGQTGTAQVLVVTGRGSPRTNSSQPPTLPVGDGLQISYSGQAQRYHSVNGRVTLIHQFDYRIAALREGSWQLGPVELPLIDGSTVSADAVEIVVRPRPELGARQEVHVEAGFSEETAWEGQVVLYRYRFESTLPGASAKWRLPAFDGLRATQQGQPAQSAYVIDDPEGAIHIQEGVVPLIATGTGRRDQGVAIATVKTPMGRPDPFGFRRVRSEPWVTDPAVLTVEPLPPAPDGFSGLVGDFVLLSDVDRERAVVGQSITWTLRIRGDGSLEGFSLPPYETPMASVYENDAQVSARVESDAYAATATFRRVLVPTEEGELRPPPFELVTFSPTAGAYETHRVELPTITVEPGREGVGEVTSFSSGLPAPIVDPTELAPRPVVTSGMASIPPLDRFMPLFLGLVAAPGVGVIGVELLLGLLTLYRRRRSERVVQITPSERIRALPADPDERLAILDELLRAVQIPGPDPELDALLRRLQRVRFGAGEPDPGLEAAIIEVVRQRGVT